MQTATAANQTCPSCLGTDSPVLHTQILGRECRACRQARQWVNGAKLYGQGAVDARRAANAGPLAITITRHEGPSDLCNQPVTVASFVEASAILQQIAQTAPDSGGYDKTGFSIIFPGGEVYEGRADIKREHEIGGYDLRAHVIEALRFYSNREQLDDATRAEAAAMLERHFNGSAS